MCLGIWHKLPSKLLLAAFFKTPWWHHPTFQISPPRQLLLNTSLQLDNATSTTSFPDLFCFKKSLLELVLCIMVSLRRIGWECNWRLHSQPIPREEASSWPGGSWIFWSLSGWWSGLGAGLGSSQPAHPKKLLAVKSSLSSSQSQIKYTGQGEERGNKTRIQRVPTKCKGFLHLLALPTAKTQS